MPFPTTLPATVRLALVLCPGCRLRAERGSAAGQQLREIYRVTYEEAVELPDAWLAWARCCRLAPFVKPAKTITKQRPGIGRSS